MLVLTIGEVNAYVFTAFLCNLHFEHSKHLKALTAARSLTPTELAQVLGSQCPEISFGNGSSLLSGSSAF